MQIKLTAKICPTHLYHKIKDFNLEEDTETGILNLIEVGIFASFDIKTGEIKGIQLDDKYPLINPIDNEMLKSIMEFRQMWKDLNTARTKVEILVKEVDDEMRAKEKAGVQWNRGKCAAWEAMTDAANVSGKLRARHGV